MKNLKVVKISFYAILFIVGSILASCSSGSKEGSDNSGHDAMETSDHHDEEGDESHAHASESEGGHEHGDEAEQGHEHGDEGEHSGHDDASMPEGGTKMWKPEGNGTELISSDFHFIVGAIENITPEVIQTESGENVMTVSSDGTPSAFVFHQSYGNIGLAAMLNTAAFKGNFKLIHHAQDEQNYEFVAINGADMKLGRVVNGEEKVFNEGSFTPSDWINLRVSAAGAHYKGYIGSKNITHGHGDKMEDGYVGIMMEGEGTVQIKSIEIAVLEDE